MIELHPHWQHRRLPSSGNQQQDQRSRYQRDKARVLHSAAFRRLQSKTQVLGSGLNDFHRTRLTHSIESAQIGSGINAQLRIRYPELAMLFDDQLIEALCLAHDIGHPPYGHGGEVALNYMMRDHGGFEGNGQTLRILSKLEPYTEHHGMNLTRRTLLGVLKYPLLQSELRRKTLPQPPQLGQFLDTSQWLPAKAVYDDDSDIRNWVLETLSDNDRQRFKNLREQPTEAQHGRSAFKSLDCAIMELADDIAYSVHDLEDAIVLGIITRPQWQKQVVRPLTMAPGPLTVDQLRNLSDQLFSNENHRRKKAIGALVNGFVTAIEVEHDASFDEPLLAYQAKLPASYELLLNALKGFVYRNVIQHSSIQRLEFKGQQTVMALFAALASEPQRLLPENTRNKWLQAVAEGHSGHRVISDYLSGMTDYFAARLHGNLFAGTNQSHDFHLIE